MIVAVADTLPLNYLVLIHCQDLLSALNERVLVPNAVIKELDHVGTPPLVRAWRSRLPEWILVREVGSPPDAALEGLDPGEREAVRPRGHRCCPRQSAGHGFSLHSARVKL